MFAYVTVAIVAQNRWRYQTLALTLDPSARKRRVCSLRPIDCPTIRGSRNGDLHVAPVKELQDA